MDTSRPTSHVGGNTSRAIKLGDKPRHICGMKMSTTAFRN